MTIASAAPRRYLVMLASGSDEHDLKLGDEPEGALPHPDMLWNRMRAANHSKQKICGQALESIRFAPLCALRTPHYQLT